MSYTIRCLRRMDSMRFTLTMLFAAAVCSAASDPGLWVVHGDEANDLRVADEGATRAERAARLTKMRGLAGQFEIVRSAGDVKQRFELRDDPLFRYSDQPRGFLDATLWAWGPPEQGGR